MKPGCMGTLFTIVMLSLIPFVWAADGDADALAGKGLVKGTSGQYTLPDETEILNGMKQARQNKVKLDQEVKARLALEKQIEDRKAFIKECEFRHTKLEEQLTTVQDVTIHNQIVGQMNLLFVKAKEASKDQQELETKSSKLAVALKAEFVDQITALGVKSDAINAKYTDLSGDADVKAAVEKINAAGKGHVKVGPSSAFTAAANQLRVWRKDIETESIPMYVDTGVNMVDVLVNGVSKRMVVDSGAGVISLSPEVAAELKLSPGPKDPPITLSMADGHTTTGRQMKLKTVRVGRFQMENIDCVVLDHAVAGAPALLGNTFLAHFVVKMDNQRQTMTLTEVSKDDKEVKVAGSESKPK